MVAVRFSVRYPVVEAEPVFFYYPDGFQKPNPFQPTSRWPLTPSSKTLDAMDALECNSTKAARTARPNLCPTTRQTARAEAAGPRGFEKRYQNQARQFRPKLVEFYGPQRAETVNARGFEIFANTEASDVI